MIQQYIEFSITDFGGIKKNLTEKNSVTVNVSEMNDRSAGVAMKRRMEKKLLDVTRKEIKENLELERAWREKENEKKRKELEKIRTEK